MTLSHNSAKICLNRGQGWIAPIQVLDWIVNTLWCMQRCMPLFVGPLQSDNIFVARHVVWGSQSWGFHSRSRSRQRTCTCFNTCLTDDVVMLYVLIVLEAPLELYARYSDFIMRCPLAVHLCGFSSPTSDCRWMDCNQIHREMNSLKLSGHCGFPS
jgi:hypothetical protein